MPAVLPNPRRLINKRPINRYSQWVGLQQGLAAHPVSSTSSSDGGIKWSESLWYSPSIVRSQWNRHCHGNGHFCHLPLSYWTTFVTTMNTHTTFALAHRLLLAHVLHRTVRCHGWEIVPPSSVGWQLMNLGSSVVQSVKNVIICRENSACVGCCAASSGNFIPTFRANNLH